jgi:hypothetical protein
MSTRTLTFSGADLRTKALAVDDDKLVVDATGNVGIGTANPTSNLHVNGSIKCDSFTLSQKSSEQGEFIVERKDNGYTQGTLPLAHTTTFNWSTSIADANYTTATSNLTFAIDDDNTGSRWMLKFLHNDADANLKVRVNAGTQHTISYSHTPEDPRENNDFSWTTIDITNDVNYAGATNTIYFWHNSTDNGYIHAVYVFPMSGPALPNEPVETDLHLYNGLLVNNSVGIGTTNPSSNLHVVGDVYVSSNVVVGTSTALGKLHISASYDQTTTRPFSDRNQYLILKKEGVKEFGTGPGICFAGAYHTTVAYEQAYAVIKGVSDATSGNGQEGRLEFYTASTNTSADVLGMVINNQGNVGIGTASPSEKISIGFDSGDYPTIEFVDTGTNIQRQAASGDYDAYFKGLETTIQRRADIQTFLYGTGPVIANSHEIVFGYSEGYNSYTNSYEDSRYPSYHAMKFNVWSSTSDSSGGSLTNVMNLFGNGSVGIGTTGAGRLLQVNGTFTLDSSSSSGGIRINSDSGNDTSINDLTGYSATSFTYCGGIGMYESDGSGRSWYLGLANDNNAFFTLAFAGGGAPDPDPVLTITTASRLYIKYIYVNGTQQHSDDRIKYNEEHITDATDTLMKLKPQKYDKYLNLSAHDTDANAYTIESGFIAQDVYYDTPELRHLVSMALDATPSDTKPETPEDITQDPDYSDWGTKKASVDYVGFIPYIVRAIQENEETKGKVRARLPMSNVADYSGLVVCSTDTPGEVALCTKHKDKRCFGVVSDVPGFVNTSGEGHVWVLGDIEAGDFITTSNTLPGYAMRQDSDFLMNYTLAKATHVTDVPVKRVRQELANVTYFVTTTYEEINEKEWNTLSEDRRATKEEIGYYEMDTDKEITIRDYNNLEEVERQLYIQKPKTIYYFTKLQESKYSREGAESVVRQELVNVLDEHGQLQWEDDPSGSAHKTRYLDASGQQTDEANAVHIAAFVGCTYHCI